MKICLLGAQGTGKSTLVRYFEEYFIIDDVARKVIAKGGKSNKEGNVASQREIFNEYEAALTREEYISTRSVIDVLAYTTYLYEHKKINSIKDVFEKIGLWIEVQRETSHVIDWIWRERDVVFCYIPIEFKLEDDGVRSVDYKYQKDIDTIMKSLFDNLELKNKYVIKGTVFQRTEILKSIIALKK